MLSFLLLFHRSPSPSTVTSWIWCSSLSHSSGEQLSSSSSFLSIHLFQTTHCVGIKVAAVTFDLCLCVCVMHSELQLHWSPKVLVLRLGTISMTKPCSSLVYVSYRLAHASGSHPIILFTCVLSQAQTHTRKEETFLQKNSAKKHHTH